MLVLFFYLRMEDLVLGHTISRVKDGQIDKGIFPIQYSETGYIVVAKDGHVTEANTCNRISDIIARSAPSFYSHRVAISSRGVLLATTSSSS
jgi:hypothetical protein